MQAIERSPFLKLDKSEVIGYLKSAGSRDPDILHTAKTRLLTAARFPKGVGLYVMIMGGLCTLMILLAPIGIPLLVFGWWLRRRGARNVEMVELGFREFSANASAA
jgi:hypothetical protein